MNILQDAPEGQELQLKDGRKIKNAQQLAETLETLSESAFHHHVSNEKNDFSDWINTVFQDNALAQQMREMRVKKLMSKQIKARLKNLKEGEPLTSLRK
ncbi:hypothetical protein HYV79_02770 [Candidatus Woesearchaeota archaeon]|nr:hypothetical protein [Candidatus Woesearchaeota archaeon]